MKDWLRRFAGHSLPWRSRATMVRPIVGVVVPDIFDEVSQDLRAERMRRLLQRYGIILVAALVLVVAGAAGWQLWQYRQRQTREAVAAQFLTAMQAANASAGKPDRARAEQSFTQIATTGPSGYRTLARLREAAIKASGGDLPGALALWDQVSADEGADRDLRRLADLLWVQHQVDGGEPALVEGRIVPLLAPDQPWRPLALENQAWLKLRTGDTAGATAALRGILAMPTAPQGIKARAAGLLSRIGDTGVSGTGAPASQDKQG